MLGGLTMRAVRRGTRHASLFAPLLLAGCGADMAVAPRVNHAPVFSSGAAVSVVENTAGDVYQAAATDADGDPLTFSITGGADAARFTLAASGALRFVAAPDFDMPGDADADNVYLVQLSVSDGSLSTPLTIQVTVTNSKEGIQVNRIASGFTQPVALVAIPGDTKLLVAEKGGDIYQLDPATGTKTRFLTVNDVGTDGDRGIIAMAISPAYAANGKFYVMYATTSGEIVIGEFNRQGQFGSPGLRNTIAFIDHGQYINDDGGWIGVAPDGTLYAATGDAGGTSDPNRSAQDPTSRLGKLLHITANPDPYAGAAPNYYLVTTVASGLHDPRGGTFYNGALLLADRGQDIAEEVDLVPLTGMPNLGWPFKEGAHVVAAGGPASLIDPVLEYLHTGSRSGKAIVGGYVYRGAIASLQGQYVFADQNGTIFTVPASQIKSGQTLTAAAYGRRNEDFAPDAGSIGQPVSIAEDANGTLYIVDADGDIFRVDAG